MTAIRHGLLPLIFLALPACRVLLPEPVAPAVPTTDDTAAPTAFASLTRVPGPKAEPATPKMDVQPRPIPAADPPVVVQRNPVLPTTPIVPPIVVSPAIPVTPVAPIGPLPPPIPDPYTALTGTPAEPPSAPPYMPPLMPVGPPAAADPPLVAAVRAYLNDDPERAVGHLKNLDGPNQELMLQLIPAIVRASQMDLTHAEPDRTRATLGPTPRAGRGAGRPVPAGLRTDLLL